MTTSGLPFDDIRNLLAQLPPFDEMAAASARRLLLAAGGAPGRLGMLEEAAAWLAGASGRMPPQVMKPQVAVFAGTHGVSRHLGTAGPVEQAQARVERIASGAAPVSHLCHANDFGLNVFDLALDLPVGDITVESALDERGCAATMAFGMEAVAGGTDFLCLSDIDTARGVPAASVLAALLGRVADDWPAGRDEEREAVARALAAHRGALKDPLEVLRRLGGREIAAIAGAILAARVQKIPVLLDGDAAIAAAAVLHALDPAALAHCRLTAAKDTMQQAAAGHIFLVPLFDFGIEAGEGVSAALAAGLVRSAAHLAAGLAEVTARTTHR